MTDASVHSLHLERPHVAVSFLSVYSFLIITSRRND